MSIKRAVYIFTFVLSFLFISIFYRNIATFYSLKKNIGYTHATIIQTWENKGSWYSRYQYKVDGEVFKGRQGQKHKINDTVLIVYDTIKPKFSMIANYSLPIILDSSNRINNLDTSLVKFRWWDYLPGDEIHSVKDLWSLDFYFVVKQ